MTRFLRALVLSLMAVASIRAQVPSENAPVRATLRIAGGRTSFKSGEPIRLQVLLTASASGFVVDQDGLDRAIDDLIVAPDEGVTRFPPHSWSDVRILSPLSDQPTVLDLVANYWLRFGRSGDYELTVATKRVSPAGKDGWSGSGERVISLTTNSVRIHVDLPSPNDERNFIANALLAIQDAESRDLKEQIAAAEQLAFLSGDEAAIEKLRQFRALNPRLSNMRSIIRRGFFMSRNPVLILKEVERELDDLTKPATWDVIMDAMELRNAVEHRPASASSGFAPPPADEPIDAYVERVHASLDGRSGESRRNTALTLFTNWGRKWPDVRNIVLHEFPQFSFETRRWLLAQYGDDLRSPELVPSMLRAIEESRPRDRREILTKLVEIDPQAAVAPLLQVITDPSVSMLYDIAEKMPPGSLSAATVGLMDVIEKLFASNAARDFTFEQKVVLLPIIADASIVNRVRAFYDGHVKALDHESRANLLGYLLKWDAAEAIARIRSALAAEDSVALVENATRYVYASGLDPIVQDWLFGENLQVASTAASILERAKRPNLGSLFETRLNGWRNQRRATLSSVPLTQVEGWFESQLVRQAHGPLSRLSSLELDSLRAACLTSECRGALK